MRSRALLGTEDEFVSLRKALLEEMAGDTVVAFYSEHCAYCKKMRKPFLAAANEYPDIKFIALKLGDGNEKNTLLARSFGITHVPTLYITKRSRIEGTPTDMTRIKYTGVAHLAELLNFVDEHIVHHQRDADK